MRPKLAVVIPIYNAKPYLEECLRSVADQHFSDLDVILVDDGSTDESVPIARRFVAEDKRFRLFVQSSRKGPGAARNIGLRQISDSVDYFSFVDSDDVLPRNAYSALLASIESSNSDMAAGNVHRFDSFGSYQFEKHIHDFGDLKVRTNIFETPGLFMDRTVWNKVYRRTFWEKQRLFFREGLLYEDAPFVVPLYCLAESVDIVNEVVYLWRIREGGAPSITQQRTVSGMADRFTAIDLVRTFLKSGTATADGMLLSYDRNLLQEEVPLFFDEFVEEDEDYRCEFVKRAAELLDDFPTQLFAGIPQELRNVYSAIVSGRAGDLVGLLQPLLEDAAWRDRLFMSTARPRGL
ncbi:glycosyltransferase family 2 protein [Streptomyces sp. NPDC001137]|uniref:glycosyltransferase family 2 protein n=1 Tax=Streptomyces sp. NPDC001137 TaxID=3154378 RepID=UPI0033303224